MTIALTGELVDGAWCWHRAGSAADAAGKPALVLDRDGVINVDSGYVRDPATVALVEGAADAIARANAAGIPVVVVTNQAGVARGLYDWPVFESVQDRIEALLALGGARLDHVFACGYHDPEHAHHDWRKPAPGMIRAAAAMRGIDLGRSWLVGDRATDLGAAHAAGLAGGVLVDSLPGQDALPDGFAVLRAERLADAIGDLVARLRL